MTLSKNSVIINESCENAQSSAANKKSFRKGEIMSNLYRLNKVNIATSDKIRDSLCSSCGS